MSRGRTERRRALKDAWWWGRAAVWWSDKATHRTAIDCEHAAVEHAREIFRRFPPGGSR